MELFTGPRSIFLHFRITIRKLRFFAQTTKCISMCTENIVPDWLRSKKQNDATRETESLYWTLHKSGDAYQQWLHLMAVLCRRRPWWADQTVVWSCYSDWSLLQRPACSGRLAQSWPTTSLGTCKKGKGIFFYSAVSRPLDRSKRFTLHPLADLFIQTPTRETNRFLRIIIVYHWH